MKKWLKNLYCLSPAVAAILLFLILPYFPQVTEYGFSRGLFRVISVPLGGALAALPVSLTEILAVLAFPAAVVILVVLIRKLVTSGARKRLLGRVARGMGWVLSSAFLMYGIMHGLNYYRLPAAELMELDTSPQSPEFLQQVCIQLAQEASREREALQEDSRGCMQLSQSIRATLRLADNGYRNLDDQYPFLWGGVWQAKPVMLSHWWSYTGITGMYFPFFAEANVNVDIPDWELPSTAAHELAHTRGFAREDECNFFAFLTCIHSDSADFRYSGYLLAYIYCSNALYAYDQELWQAVQPYVSSGMGRDLQAQNAYWDQFEGEVQEISSSINNSFIEAHGDEDGVLSYNRVVQLVLGYYLQPDN